MLIKMCNKRKNNIKTTKKKIKHNDELHGKKE
jgi:hypothetical protein